MHRRSSHHHQRQRLGFVIATMALSSSIIEEIGLLPFPSVGIIDDKPSQMNLNVGDGNILYAWLAGAIGAQQQSDEMYARTL